MLLMGYFISCMFMIITCQKKIEDILGKLDKKPVFIIGCSECATLCHTGGEKEVISMKESLEENGVDVTGWVVLDPACHLLNDKRLLKKHQKDVDKASKVLVLACGNGVQTVSEIIVDKDVFSGTDTLFLGEIKRLNDFEKRCIMCGECIEDEFEGFCPVSRCPKNLLNGPCGGAVDGKCEVDSDLDCVWILIYNRLKERGKLDTLKVIRKPKNWSKSLEMRRKI